MVATRRSAVKAKKEDASPAPRSNAASSSGDKYDEGTNYVEAGIEANPYFFALILAAPFLSLLLAYLTSAEMEADHPGMATAPLGGMAKGLLSDPAGAIRSVLLAGLSVTPSPEAIQYCCAIQGRLELLDSASAMGLGLAVVTSSRPGSRDARLTPRPL